MEPYYFDLINDSVQDLSDYTYSFLNKTRTGPKEHNLGIFKIYILNKSSLVKAKKSNNLIGMFILIFFKHQKIAISSQALCGITQSFVFPSQCSKVTFFHLRQHCERSNYYVKTAHKSLYLIYLYKIL